MREDLAWFWGLVNKDLAAPMSGVTDVTKNPIEIIRKEAASETTRLREENARLREALKGVIRIADRNTIEFDAARAAIREGGEVENQTKLN